MWLSKPTNVEAGSDPEDTRVNQVFDRVNTVGTVWLGTTVECCQCHDHKYDPFTQRDYYRLFAFFNGTALEADRANPKVPGSIRFLGPAMTLDDPATAAARAKLEPAVAEVVSLEPVGVGVPGGVEPRPRPLHPELRRREQPVDHLLVGVR